MILYHGSPAIVSAPDVFRSRGCVDLGGGFYTTPLRERAVQWCQRFMRADVAYLNVNDLDERAFSRFSVLQFESYSEPWLDFVMSCRSGQDQSSYDLVMGGVVDDWIFNTIELFLEGLISKREALNRLMFEKPNCQLCIRNQTVIDECLRFAGSERM